MNIILDNTCKLQLSRNDYNEFKSEIINKDIISCQLGLGLTRVTIKSIILNNILRCLVEMSDLEISFQILDQACGVKVTGWDHIHNTSFSS